MATVLVADQCEIPGDVATLDAFRRWARSPAFPSLGRIDWVASCIEVDMSPEDIFTHGTVKSEIVRVVGTLAKPRGMHLFTGETRVSADVADLSAEPDVVVVSEAAIEAGRVRLVPAAGGRPDRFVELEGGPDLVVEIVSDSSVRKDTERLPAAYHAAGVREFWLVDARGAEVRLTIHRWEPGGWATDSGPDGACRSAVFNSAEPRSLKPSRSSHVLAAVHSASANRRATIALSSGSVSCGITSRYRIVARLLASSRS